MLRNWNRGVSASIYYSTIETSCYPELQDGSCGVTFSPVLMSRAVRRDNAMLRHVLPTINIWTDSVYSAQVV